MGISSSKQTSKTNQTESGTSTPVAPPWLTEQLQNFGGQVGALGQADPNQFVAPAAPLQNMAFENVSQLGAGRPQAATASGLAFDAGTSPANLAGARSSFFPSSRRSRGLPLPAADLLPGDGYSQAQDQLGYAQQRPGQPIGFNPALTGASQAGAYADPFQSQVIDTTLEGYDRDAGERRAQLSAAGARNGAFGGSRFGIAEGQFDADTALGRAQTEAGLRSQGFNTANQFGMQDAASGNNMFQFNANQEDEALNRQLQAAGLLTDQSNAYDANTRADLGVMSGLGETQRGIEGDFASAPLDLLLAQAGLTGAIPYDALVGRNITGTSSGTNVTKSSPSLFSQGLKLAQAAAMFV